MSKNIDDVYKEVIKINKDIQALDKKVSNDIAQIKKFLKGFDKKLSLVLEKIQEFEIIMDAAEMLEEHMEDEEDKYNTEWSPYNDDDYESEDYEDYDGPEEDES